MDEGIIAYIEENLEVSNSEPIVGDITISTTEEIKHRAINVFATQNRAVTKQDYISSAYAMPSKFGAIKRCTAYRDPDDLKRNINMYVLSENAAGKLTSSNTTIKNNLKNWLNTKRMISDTIDILDTNIINIAVKFKVIAKEEENVFLVLKEAQEQITRDAAAIRPEIGEAFYISNVFKSLKDVPSILDVVNVELVNKSGGVYSEYAYSIDENLSIDGRVLRIPPDAIWEIKFPYSDILGIIK